MNTHRLRAIILNLQDRLSDNDRKRLHFFLGNDVPRRIRDDPSLSGTLCLMESLFDQDKISDEDFTFLINAFDEIQCLDAVRLLRDHMRQMSSGGTNESIQSLSLVMPPLLNQILDDQEEDRYAVQAPLFNEETYTNSNNFTINSHNRTSHSEIITDGNQILPEQQNQLLNISPKTHKYCILFILSLIIQIGLLIGVCLWIFQLKIQINHHINNNNVTTSLHLKYLLLKDNDTLHNLKNLLSIDDEKVEKLNKSIMNNNKAIKEFTGKINFLNDEEKYIEGTTCGCAKWCSEQGSRYGLCGNGHTCICQQNPINKHDIGCRCNSWCQRRNYTDGICGDGYTCICSK